jgi:hypothetical protein
MTKASHRTLDKKKKNTKAQLWSADFMFGMVLLVLLLTIFLISWNDLSIRWNTAEKYRELKMAALYVADSLLTTSGEPKSWEILNLTTQINQVKAIGLVNNRNVLDNEKLATLKAYENSSYDQIKNILGLSKYEMNLKITDKNANVTYYEFGKKITANNESAVIERLAIFNDSLSIVKLTVWAR